MEQYPLYKNKQLPYLFIVLLLLIGVVVAVSVLIQKPLPLRSKAASGLLIIPPTFPKFFASDPNLGPLLTDMFYRHYSQQVGPSAFTGDQQTNWREWNALSSVWVNTTLNKVSSTSNKPSVYGGEWPADDMHDYNRELRHALLTTKMDADGYVWMYGSKDRGWPFPEPPCSAPGQTGCYDTRHPVTNTSFILASKLYYLWTGDRDFLQANMPRIRNAIHFLQTNQKGDAYWVLQNEWAGHDGVPGTGTGIGSNYWDLLPFGWRDTYATMQYYASLQAVADLEDIAKANPNVSIPVNQYGETPESFRHKASMVKQIAGNYFWWDPDYQGTGSKNYRKGRFFGVVDKNGNSKDYGFVWLNLEAIYYGFASSDQTLAILDWLDGKIILPGDTSIGSDIYKWVFAPRSSTRNNPDWYLWLWGANHTWEDQVQNGGTSFYLSFFDLFDRVKYLGADNAFRRLQQITNWYQTVQNAGGYRSYYPSGMLQGCSTPGKIGIDCEFVESTIVPTSFLYGFLGIEAKGDGLHITPKIPSNLSYIGVENLYFQGNTFKITAQKTGSTKLQLVKPRSYEVTVLDGQEYVIPPRIVLDAPTNTPAPQNPNLTLDTAKVNVTLLLHGIGKGGDTVNPVGTSSSRPIHAQRTVSLEFYDLNNQLILSSQGMVSYNPAGGNFQGIITVANISAGYYRIKVKVSRYLQKLQSETTFLAPGQTVSLASLALTAGDSNDDNRVSILDYNMLIDCFSDFVLPRDCSSSKKKDAADLTDDGNVNQFDYNLLIRGMSAETGQ